MMIKIDARKSPDYFRGETFVIGAELVVFHSKEVSADHLQRLLEQLTLCLISRQKPKIRIASKLDEALL